MRLARKTEAGKKLSPLILVQKHTFTRPLYRVDNEQSLMLTIRAGGQRAALVSVLDLDNTLVSAGIHRIGRGNSRLSARIKPEGSQHPSEIITLRGAIKHVVSISLYDVNSSDWTSKNAAALLLIQSSAVFERYCLQQRRVKDGGA